MKYDLHLDLEPILDVHEKMFYDDLSYASLVFHLQYVLTCASLASFLCCTRGPPLALNRN